MCVAAVPQQQQVHFLGAFMCQARSGLASLLDRGSSPHFTGELTEAQGGDSAELGVRTLRAGPCSGVCWALGGGGLVPILLALAHQGLGAPCHLHSQVLEGTALRGSQGPGVPAWIGQEALSLEDTPSM